MSFQLTAAITLAAASVVSAQTTLVGTPPIVEDSFSSGSQVLIGNAPFVFQQFIDGSQIPAGSQPRLITGLTFRLARFDQWRPSGYVDNTWPQQNVTWSDMRVSLGTPASNVSNPNSQNNQFGNFPLQSTSPTFTSVIAPGTDRLVKSGSAVLEAGSFSHSPTGANGNHPYSTYIMPFDTPYLYNPGADLIVTFRHGGTLLTAATAARFASRPTGRNFVDAWGNTSGNINATTPTPNVLIDPIYMQFRTTAVPEPTTVAAGAAAGTVLLSRRRRKA
jgi:hypothetical protein